MEKKFIRVDEVAKELRGRTSYLPTVTRNTSPIPQATSKRSTISSQLSLTMLLGSMTSVPTRQQKPETWAAKNAKRCCSGRKRNIRSLRRK